MTRKYSTGNASLHSVTKERDDLLKEVNVKNEPFYTKNAHTLMQE